jgi:hypothetical protein
MNMQFTAPSHKQALRLSRRLRRHGIDVNFTLGSTDVVIEVGRRVVHINPTGDIRQALKPQRTSLGWRADPQGLAAYHHRMQALYLGMAASARAMGSYQSGRVFTDSARLDRLYGSAF